MSLLDEAYRRVRQCNKRLADLKERIGQLQSGKPVRIYAARTRSFSVGASYAVSEGLDDLTPLVGECLQHLMTALNYLVSALVAARGHPIDENLQFPVCDSVEKFQRRTTSELKGVGGREVALIESLQPYNGSQWLRRVNDLTRSDRHRIPVVLTTGSRTTVRGTARSHFEAKSPMGMSIWLPSSMDMTYEFSGPILFKDDQTPV